MPPKTEPTFTCTHCGTSFSVRAEALDRYPGWRPNVCLACRDKKKPAKTRAYQPKPPTATPSRPPRAATATAPPFAKELNLSVKDVLERFQGGPATGVFTDGACTGNPGPGGWGVVYVNEDQILEQHHGHDAQTTNNRMELTAIIAGYRLLPNEARVDMYSDSELCVKTLTLWAASWEARGWRRKGGEVKNLDLVQQAWALAKAHPHVRLQWIKAHNGARWNEYADALATAYLRNTL